VCKNFDAIFWVLAERHPNAIDGMIGMQKKSISANSRSLNLLSIVHFSALESDCRTSSYLVKSLVPEADLSPRSGFTLVPYVISLSLVMVFFGGGAYGSLPDAAIWWCLPTGGGAF